MNTPADAVESWFADPSHLLPGAASLFALVGFVVLGLRWARLVGRQV